MRVLLITGSYPPMKCGVGSYTQKLALSLSQHHDVDEVVVLTDERARDVVQQKGVLVLPVIQNWQIIELGRIAKYIKQYNPDIVHIQYPTQGYSGRVPALLPLLVRLLRKPCIQTWHEPVTATWWGMLLLLKMDALVFVKDNLISSLPRVIRWIVKRKDTTLILLASLLPVIKVSSDEILEIRRVYAPNNETLICFFGFLAPLKGVEALLKIVARTEAQLLIASDLIPENVYHKSILDKIIEMGIGTRVAIVGFLSDERLVAILAASDVAAFPFRDGAKSWNTSIDGAVAQGIFVLTTSLDYSGYQVARNIYFAKPGNIEEMIAAIQQYAGKRNPAKSSILEWQVIADKHVGIYKRFI